ncbi:uncharacterized protein UBRO_20174 [Ustilago bromivora]|uniref:Uncharacterized protein n=1 Tax=Ustilago bromivora TaxID=307758 RepID=A0A1K0GCN6_9BASI|nr:uncharacterized protein UBRO_20174 [Ustilago bromivora]
MSSVTLSNHACTERATNQGPNVYPFWDADLNNLYSRLIPPADSNLINTSYVPPQGTTLHNCWINTTVSIFAEPHTIWPFENTTTLDHDGIPTDIGWLEPEDLGDKVVEALGTDDPTTRPDTPPPAKLLSQPEMIGIRTCKYHIKTMAKFKDITCFWKHCANITYNAAATRLNVISHNSLLPHVYDLYQQLRDNQSPFVNRHPHLCKCPHRVQQAAIDKALAARKAILTTYWNKNPPQGPIPALSHCSKAKDRQNSFLIFLSPNSTHEDGSLGAPKLKIAPKIVKCCSGGEDNTLGCEEDTWAKICLCSQRGHHFLKDHCKAVSELCTTKLEAGHKWGIQLDRYGDWYLLLCYNVPTSVVPQEQSLKQAIVVKSVNPGVRTLFAVYSSDGCMLDVGSQVNGICLEQLRHCNDKIQGCHCQRHQPHHQQLLPPLQMTSNPRLSQQVQAQPQEACQHHPALPFALSSVQHCKLQKCSKKVCKKLQQLIDDLHCQMANYLVTSSDIVVMPRMKVCKMIQRKNGNLH